MVATQVSLRDLGLLHGTDKAGHHDYVRWYAQWFDALRERPVTLLELGYGGHEDPEKGGASALMWRDYFRNGKIVVADVEEKTLTDKHAGINFRRGSQDDPAFLSALHDEFGDFDIIIDDASHLSSLTIRSLELLWPMLKRGGIYAVEDTHMAYHSHYYGVNEANENPDLPTATGAPTAMQYLRRMADDVNFKGSGRLDLFPQEFWRGYALDWVHFSFNLAAMRKAP